MILIKNPVSGRVLNITSAVELYTAQNGCDLIAADVGSKGIDYRIVNLTLEELLHIIQNTPTKTFFTFTNTWKIPYLEY